jgi:mono/diheme cytochrome c family protein
LAPVLIATLSAAQKAAIAGMGAAFIVFALVSSFVIPRRRPDFPGRRVRPYVALVVCFFAAMMAVVVFAGREKSEAKAAGTTSPTSTSPSPTPTPTPAPAPAPTGDPVAGKAIFAAQGCAACHTFRPAGSTGTIGPDLDKLAADAKTANRGSIAQYATESIANPNAYIVPRYKAGRMPQNFGTTLSKKQIDDLVAFLLKPA